MKPKTTHGFKRIKNATRYSCQGLKAAFKHEPAFQEEVVLASLMIPAAFFIADSQLERFALIGTVVLVLVAELFNSAIEAVVDRASPEHHPLAGRAKDIGSAAVMVTMLLTAYVWLEVLFF
ncbi:diacylglycerol kinase [Vibrio aquaticus]|uniref:Diacylglycerol kinase n=1 Tax=Vibrio aquaticus TaxID=2496559 RepID=A0A432CUW1_9VIBR|nr:diacylglycerol kinase [Vibrio aquaticus]RTZ13802.1 diacylglycerol kinase [Vibrio aquaticus]